MLIERPGALEQITTAMGGYSMILSENPTIYSQIVGGCIIERGAPCVLQ